MILKSCCLAEKLQNVKKKCFIFGGGKINQPGQLAPGGEDNQGGGQDIPGYLAPGGQAVQGGKINCYTGFLITRLITNITTKKGQCT